MRHAIIYIIVAFPRRVVRWIRCLRTTEASKCPIAPDVSRSVGKLKSKWPSIRVQVSVHSCDIDGIGLWSLTHFGFLGKDAWRIIINIQQVDLQCACSTCRRNTCRLEWKRKKQQLSQFVRPWEQISWATKAILWNIYDMRNQTKYDIVNHGQQTLPMSNSASATSSSQHFQSLSETFKRAEH